VADLEKDLRTRVAAGARIFVPYVTGGLPGVDAGLLRSLEDREADAIEVGIPFSDPVMDGAVIQEASRRALESGATPKSVLDVIAEARLRAPVVVMTYLNPVLAAGFGPFLDRAREADVAGVIVPDLPSDDAAEWCEACRSRGIASVFLAAPGSSNERLRRVAALTRGFVYCVSMYGVTGERESLAGTAREVVDALRPLTSTPLVVGVGIGTPEAATEACTFADGVVVGSALVRPLLESDREGMLELAKRFRNAVG
jgi:tryptophan synthase alpha chain